MTADRAHHRDVESRFEDAGIPDPQDGTPEQQQAEDPRELPLPGDQPGASVDWGTTAEEQAEGEPLSSRLSREEPDAVLSDDGADGADASVGRLVNEQDVVPGDDEVDTEAADVGKDWGGLTQEEQAMHIEPE